MVLASRGDGGDARGEGAARGGDAGGSKSGRRGEGEHGGEEKCRDRGRMADSSPRWWMGGREGREAPAGGYPRVETLDTPSRRLRSCPGCTSKIMPNVIGRLFWQPCNLLNVRLILNSIQIDPRYRPG
ncbi:hypothetical protein FGB62_122g038 [Gracilaria domingensis]|nr:hypothetical protein FGB62_122g038 [Gracilaria domingensis]